MVKNPPEGMPRLMPYLFYNDVPSLFDWLKKTFQFDSQMEPGLMGEGVYHAELKYKDSIIMIGTANPEIKHLSPTDLTGINQSIFMYVDDVDKHYQYAKEAGAPNITEPMDMFWGDRMYTVADPEGHHWSFATHIKDVAPEDMVPPQ